MTKREALAKKASGESTPVFDRKAHFRKLSRQYCRLRTFDAAPLLEIHRALPTHDGTLKGFDIGCGTGRYTFPFLKMLADSNPALKIEMMLIDACRYMLAMAKRRAKETRGDVHFIKGDEGVLANHPNDFDFGMTTNAIHHFDVLPFLRQAAAALRSGGRLFIYTRTQEQNRRIIWGQYFPGFAEREIRLPWEGQMERLIAEVGELKLAGAKSFAYSRVSSLQRLLDQARGRHYSTFRFYKKQEFEDAVAGFEHALRSGFPDLENIEHVDENTLYVAGKR